MNPIEKGPVSLCIGNFDGVHEGHRQLLEVSKLHRGLQSWVLTFDPHPIQVLFPQKNYTRLFSEEDQRTQLIKNGAHHHWVHTFTKDFSRLSASDFFFEFLVKTLFRQGCPLKALVVGQDFRFGRGREGGTSQLRTWCDSLDIDFHEEPPVLRGGEVVSTTAIKEALIQGRVKKAREFLGRPYYFQGRVSRGDGRGKKLGFPTANIFPAPGLYVPCPGVYITRTEILEETGAEGEDMEGIKTPWRPSLTNLGVRPTFQDLSPNPLFETHILNFDQDIYDREVRVEVLDFLRHERSFPGPGALIQQIEKDLQERKRLFGEEGL